jgi:hypothetical protein
MDSRGPNWDRISEGVMLFTVKKYLLAHAGTAPPDMNSGVTVFNTSYA